MADPISAIVAGKFIETAVSKGFDAVEKFFSGKKEEKPIMSVGLAVGYYYGFLDSVSANIKTFNQIQLFNEVKRENGQIDHVPGEVFPEDCVKIQIILPKRLDNDAYRVCESEFKAANRASIYLGAQGRYYGINYSIASLAKSNQLTIIDLARPLMAIKRYYEDIVKMDTFDPLNQGWLAIQVAEVAAFKETLRRLQARGYGGALSIDFLERG